MQAESIVAWKEGEGTRDRAFLQRGRSVVDLHLVHESARHPTTVSVSFTILGHEVVTTEVRMSFQSANQNKSSGLEEEEEDGMDTQDMHRQTTTTMTRKEEAATFSFSIDFL